MRPNLTNYASSINLPRDTAPKPPVSAHLLLFHQLGVGTIIHNPSTENRCREGTVYFLGIGILQLAIEDKFIAFGAQEHRCFFAQENEGKDIAVLRTQLAATTRCKDRAQKPGAHLLTTSEEKDVGIDSIRYGASNKRDPMKNQRRLFGIAE